MAADLINARDSENFRQLMRFQIARAQQCYDAAFARLGLMGNPSDSCQGCAIAATAKGMFEWRRKHRHCAACGERSEVAEAGWKRVCTSCKAEHFPRTDPVVIMLAVHEDRCMLGRQEIWPKGMFSALAGFLEPGESIEEACARELNEEAGLKTLSVAYHSTQPWPYPSSLMIGLIAADQLYLKTDAQTLPQWQAAGGRREPGIEIPALQRQCTAKTASGLGYRVLRPSGGPRPSGRGGRPGLCTRPARACATACSGPP